MFGTPTEIVMDPVHGGIWLFDYEMAVIDHPLFQRLRYITQNDVMHFVFPGATHTRFLHSIGTLYVAGKLFRSLIHSAIASRRKTIAEGEESQLTEAVTYMYKCVRLAALLHDTGHAPFSHQFENSEKVKGLLKDERTRAAILEGELKDFYPDAVKGNPEKDRPRISRLAHEHYSAWYANKILRDDKPREERPTPEDVVSIMETTTARPSEQFENHAEAIRSHLFDDAAAPKEPDDGSDKKTTGELFATLCRSIISGPVDADKMDYLLRDSHFTGVKYGLYNIDVVIPNFLPRNSASLARGSEAGFVGWGGALLYG